MTTSKVARLAMCTVGLCASALLGVPSADAAPFGPTPYLSAADSPFAGLPFTYFFLEDFDDSALNTPGVTANFAPSAVIITTTVFGSGIDSVGGAGDSMFSFGGPITYTFDAAALGGLPTHAGIVWTDGSDGVTFTAVGPGGPLGTIGPASGFADGGFNGETAEDRFFGFSDPGGILSITINQGGAMEVDHLQYGLLPGVVIPGVPEPATMLLFASGAAGLGFAGWRRQRKS